MNPSMLKCPEGHPVRADDTECPVCRTILMPPAGPRDDAISVFPGYEVIEKLGQGGMGEVYRVRNLELRREEAIKRIRSSRFASEEERAMFRREAEAVAKVRHPGIVQIHRVGEAEECPFFAMEFVSGGTLARKVGDQAMTPAEAAEMVRRLAEALNTAHQQRLVHLDLKPDNVLLTPEGDPKIADFGLAGAIEDDNTVLRDWVGGTPGYMAPEQIDAGSQPIGPAADIFALGATLYRLLTGRPPVRFANDGHERSVRDWRGSLREAYARPIAPPRSISAQVPADLDAVCMRCLETDPQKRYPSAAALAEDLGRHLRLEPTIAFPLTRRQRFALWTRRRPAIALLSFALTIAVIGGLASTSFFAWDAYQQAGAARTAEGTAKTRAEEATEEAAKRLKEKRLSDRRGYVANMRLVQMSWESSQPDRLRPLLDQQLPHLTDGIDLRGFEWHFWNHVAQSAVVHPVGNMCQGVAFGKDGNLLAAGCLSHVWLLDRRTGKEARIPLSAWTVAIHPNNDLLIVGSEGGVYVWDIAGKKQIERIAVQTKEGGWVRGLALSPDGKTLAWAYGDNVWVRALEGGPVVKLPSGQGIAALAFSRDGALLASGGNEGVELWDASTWKRKARPSNDDCRCLAFSPVHNQLVVSGDRLEIHDLTVQTSRILPRPDEAIDGVAFSADGKTVAGACYDGVIRLWDAARGNEKGALRGHTRRVTSVAYSPDGKDLVSGGMDDVVRFWSTDRDPGTVPVPAIKWDASRICFVPNSIRMIRAGADLTLLDLSTGKTVWSVVPPTLDFASVAASPDGQWVLGGCYRPRQGPKTPLLLFDAANGKQIRELGGPKATVGAVAFHPDSTRFACIDFDDMLYLGSIHRDQPDKAVQLERSKQPLAIAYLNAEELVATDPKGGVVVLDAADGTTKFRFQGHSQPVLAVAVSKDGKLLATGSKDLTIKVWDIAGKKELHHLSGHFVSVTALAFSPDGKRLASVSNDRTLRLWDLEIGQEVLQLTSRDVNYTSVAFSDDGQYLATCAFGPNFRLRRPQASEIRVWHAPR